MQFESGVVSAIGGVNIHYRRGGVPGKTPIVLSRGITDSSECWPGVVGLLEATFDVVAVDARGHGQSDRPAVGYSYEKQVSDLLAVINQLELEGCVLIGHSMGAQTSAMAAGMAPDVVSRLVLEDPHWRAAMPEGRGGKQYSEIISYFAEMDEDEIRASCRMLHPGWHDHEVEPWVHWKHEVAEGVVSALRPVNWEQTVDALQCPTLLITGDIDAGALVTRPIAEAAVQRNPELREVRIGGAGHSVRRDKSEVFLEALRRFLV